MNDGIAGLMDQDSGFLAGTTATNRERIVNQAKRIEVEQARVNRLQADLEKRIVEADATIAMLEQQATYFTNMFEAMRANQKSYS
jgi:hypothetical protein